MKHFSFLVTPYSQVVPETADFHHGRLNRFRCIRRQQIFRPLSQRSVPLQLIPSPCSKQGQNARDVTSLIELDSPSDVGSSAKDVAVVLLAGGYGKRMNTNVPKQFLDLRGKLVIEYSLELFSQLPQVSQIVLVVSEEHRGRFKKWTTSQRFTFADPGSERQDSVYNGLSRVRNDAVLVCIHDTARPLVTHQAVLAVLKDARKYGAAVLGVPVKGTIKDSQDGKFVTRTIERSRLWEVQTPQVIRYNLRLKGFKEVKDRHLAVTDDASIVEHIGEPVRITLGDYSNIKLTTPEDMDIAQSILEGREEIEKSPILSQ